MKENNIIYFCEKIGENIGWAELQKERVFTMLKRLVAGLTAILMLSLMGSFTVFANNDEGYDSGVDSYESFIELDDDVLPDGEDDYSLSTNIMLQELLQEVEEEEHGARWGGGSTSSTHGIIASACMSEFGSDYTQSQLELIEKCLVYGAYKADTKDLHHREGDKVPTSKNGSFYPKSKLDLENGVYHYTDDVVSYHAVAPNGGYGNYLKYLKCIWKYAKQVSKVTYSNGNYYDSELTDSIKTSVNVSSINSEKMDINNLLYSIHFIFNHYAAKNNLNRALTNTEKKYLVIGLGLHLIGDIYAHRGCVPTIYAEDPDFTHEFVDSGYILTDKLEALRTKIAAGDFCCTKFSPYIDKNNMGDYTSVNQIFEDRTTFVPQRYYISITASKNFVSEILISGNTFHASNIILNNYRCPYPIFYPYQNYYEALLLHNYSTYLNDL